MLRGLFTLLLSAALLASCGDGMKNKEKVQAAILERLQSQQSKIGLDVSDLDVTTTAVTFDKNLAYATVAMHPKGDTAVSHGMLMKYTLENRDGKWTVVKLNSPQGSPMAGHGAGDQLPAGHPAVGAGEAPVLPSPMKPGVDGPSR